LNIWLEGFGQHLGIAGFKEVTIKEVDVFLRTVKEKTDNACVQFLDASLVAGWEHLQFAALNALSAFKSKANISNSLAMEILLYASAQRQIKEAVRLAGLKPTTSLIAVVVLSENVDQIDHVLSLVSELLRGERDDSVVDLTMDKVARLKRFFGISEAELQVKTGRKDAEKEALLDLVIEHMALLVTRR
jgi:tRNA threonylcarbamoyladenosine modification (KEOPS) complex Cgi121 subunit